MHARAVRMVCGLQRDVRVVPQSIFGLLQFLALNSRVAVVGCMSPRALYLLPVPRQGLGLGNCTSPLSLYLPPLYLPPVPNQGLGLSKQGWVR